MKKPISLAPILLLSGAAAFALRLLMNFIGFDAAGLPIRGSLLGILTPLVVLALLLLWALLCWKFLPAEMAPGPGFPAPFALSEKQLFPLIAGLFLMILSGGGTLVLLLLNSAPMEAISADGTMVSTVVMVNAPVKMLLFAALLALLSGLLLFPAALVCRKAAKPLSALSADQSTEEAAGSKAASLPSSLLLIASVLLVIRLVIVYRIHSVDPVLFHYAAAILAQACIILALYRLGAFAAGCGNTRRFALYGGWAVILSLTAMGEGGNLFSILFFLGAALTLLGFLLPRFDAAQAH